MRSDVSDFQLCYLNLTSHDFSHIDNEQAQKLKQWQAFLECVDKIFEKKPNCLNKSPKPNWSVKMD